MENKHKYLHGFIEKSTTSFKFFFKRSLSLETIDFLELLTKQTNAYVFSGFIRDFFLNVQHSRDIDIILDYNDKAKDLIEAVNPKKNSFGGYKVNLGSNVIDLWFIKNTWALANDSKLNSMDFPQSILSSPFFNCSSILFDLQKNKFFYKDEFVNFLYTKELEILYEPNPNFQLCILNSFYYLNKFHLKLGPNLREYLLNRTRDIDSNFENIQLTHFNEIKFTKEEIFNFVDNI